MSSVIELLKLPSYTYADVSTGHITKRDAELLEIVALDQQSPTTLTPERVFTVYGYDLGFFIAVPEEESREAALTFGYSDALCNLIQMARRDGHVLVRLDSDGTQVPFLPTFEW